MNCDDGETEQVAQSTTKMGTKEPLDILVLTFSKEEEMYASQLKVPNSYLSTRSVKHTVILKSIVLRRLNAFNVLANIKLKIVQSQEKESLNPYTLVPDQCKRCQAYGHSRNYCAKQTERVNVLASIKLKILRSQDQKSLNLYTGARSNLPTIQDELLQNIKKLSNQKEKSGNLSEPPSINNKNENNPMQKVPSSTKYSEVVKNNDKNTAR